MITLILAAYLALNNLFILSLDKGVGIYGGASDLISVFLSIELQSYGLYILSTLYRDSEKATGAGLTYFLLGGLSSCFILLGSSLLYVNSVYQKFLLIPDVYDAIPTIVTTFVAIIAKISIFIFLLELVYYTCSLVQTRIKRLYAYSTISHVGFILLGLSVNSIESIQAYIFYIITYTLSNLNAFLILLAIAVSLSITLFSFVGVPPLFGFFAKQMILSAALDSGYYFITLVAILTSVIGAVYYLSLVKQIFFFK
ncbi:hypothetical protein BT93_L3864, partial [Corymbia citriodora subsp. variegata]